MHGTDPQPPKRKIVDAGFAVVAGIAAASAAAVWWRDGTDAVLEILAADALLLAALLPKILGGVLLATALGFMLPREQVQRLVGPGSGVRGLCIAALAGAVLPGGPAVVFPLAVAVMSAGADMAAGVAMLSGWVLLSADRTLIWELSFLPPDLVALRVAVTLPVPVLLGLALRAVLGRRA